MRYGVKLFRILALLVSIYSPLIAFEEYPYIETGIENSCCGCPPACCPEVHAHRFYIGPEIYGVKRNREGGTRQSGTVFAGKLGYEHIKRCRLYWGFEALYGGGRLTGENANGDKIRSNFTDTWVEGRFGYTFQQKCGYKLALTPYVGGGYAEETNKFIHPTVIKVKFRTYYPYACVGFLSTANITERWMAGINFKAKFIFDAKNRITNDPEYDSVTQLIRNRTHYRVELPISYYPCACSDRWMISLIPFYEYRRYGSLPGFPFDFVETTYNLYGAFLKFSYAL